MRIISQDGIVDVPYELTAIHRCNKSVRMSMAGDTWKGSILATYSTEAKAIKAMEMLREAYVGKLQKTKQGNVMIDFEASRIFQFPKDENVEVEDE